MHKIEVLEKEKIVVSPLEMKCGTFGEIIEGSERGIVFKTAAGENLVRLWDLDTWDKAAMKHYNSTMTIKPIPVGSVIRITVGEPEE